MTTTHLYRHFDAEGALLYVGISLSAVNRLSQHKDCSHWFDDIARVDIETFPSRHEALRAEKAAILAENPRHNLRRPGLREQDAVRQRRAVEESRTELLRRVVLFDPMYTFDAAGRVLCVGPTTIKRLVEEGKLGSVDLGQGRPRRRVTGWQLLEYIEALQAEQSCSDALDNRTLEAAE